MKPSSVLYFIGLVFLFLLGLMAVFPKTGLQVSESYKFTFPGIAEFFVPDTAQKKDLSHVFAELDLDVETEIPLAQVVDSAQVIAQAQAIQVARQDSMKRSASRIQYPEGDRSILYAFFEKLDKASTQNVRITHYGDSQIEGDRITGYYRNELQSKFGGDGPGLFPLIPVAPRLWANNALSENWRRYTGFGRVDTTIRHKEYGAMLSFCRYAPYYDSIDARTPVHNAWFEIAPRFSSRSTVFREMSMFYNNAQAPVSVQVFNGEDLYYEDSLVSNKFGLLKVSFDKPAPTIKINFSGQSGPDILGFSISSGTGVIADNIPLRGASGTEFSKIDKVSLEKMLRALSPDLLILQFGGNVLPYVTNEEKAKSYGKWLESHIKLVRKMAPGAQVLVIGPADMSVKEGAHFVTHPFMEEVRDAVKYAAFGAGAAFWDMYEAMGGKNSMPVWVNSEPALAANDYIHFSPLGAKKIAKIFYNQLIHDYNSWKNNMANGASAKN